MSDPAESDAEHVGEVNQMCEACGQNGYPPAECPQCGTVILGAAAEDWGEHFAEDCTPLGQLYCFAASVMEEKSA